MRSSKATLVLVLILALVLATGTASALAAPVPAPQTKTAWLFSDVPPDHPDAGAIGALFLAGVVQGDELGRFRPDDTVTRAELVKMILIARGIAVSKECRPQFHDVPCTTWYGPYVHMGHRLALVEGRGGGRFEPSAPVTRQEAYVITVRALGKWYEIRRTAWSDNAAKLAVFGDGNAVADWAMRSVAFLAGRGILTSGPGPAAFLQATQTATRAEIATLLQRALLPTIQGRNTIRLDGTLVRYARAMDMQTTKYATGEPGVGTITYTSLKVRVGVVAVDPTVIPLGSLLYVPGYGYCVAADIGGAIKGHKIDLYTEDLHEAALRYGVRPLPVYLLD